MHPRPAFAAIAAAAAVFWAGVPSGLPPASAATTEDACSLLTQAQVSQALGAPMGAGDSHGTPKACDWRESGGSKRVLLVLLTLDQFNYGKAPAPGTTKAPVGGIGDDAYTGRAPSPPSSASSAGTPRSAWRSRGSSPQTRSRPWRRPWRRTRWPGGDGSAHRGSLR